jgi:4-hydroxy-3-methylbut-2-enyl diphosphate reductase
LKVILASPRGFCAGVNMAIECLERALALFGPPFYVYHEIVHNKLVVEDFRRRGVVFVDDVEQVPPGSCLMYSAHGVSPEVRRAAERRRLRTLDATCPLVNKVHSEAVRFARQGYTIVLIGHRGHDEVIGTLGQAPNHMVLVETIGDVDRLEVPNPNKIAYVTQTTLSVDEASRIVERLRQQFPKIIGPPKEDICYATQNRQDAVKALVGQAEIVLVLGSQNSSNTNRLVELARQFGKPAHLIDSADEIDPGWFMGHETVLVTAGASAPETAVSDCLNYLRDSFGATLEEYSVREEDVEFQLPVELRHVR